MDIQAFMNDSLTLTNREMAARYSCNERTVRKWKTKYRGSFPGPIGETYNKYPIVESDRTLILSDIEVPCHDPEVLEQALEIAKKYSLDTLIINGDFVALDSFSMWARSAVYKLAFKDEKEPALEILKVFLSHFSHIIITTGNHERRLAHKMDGHITIGDFFHNLTGVEYSEYAFCYLKSGGKTILVCHQDNYARKPLTVASDLCAIHHMPIISGHCHHLAQGYDRSGKYWIVDGGSARSPEHTRYKATRINLFPNWCLGFCFVIKGVPFLVDKNNFDFYMGEN
jgi:predicted phosphodiesterase